MHLKRLIVAVILLPLIYLYIMYLSPGFFLFLVSVVCILALLEFYSIYRISGVLRFAGAFLVAPVLGVSYVFREILGDVIIFSVMALLTIRLLSKKDPISSLSDVSPPVVGLLYIPCLFTFQIQIREFGPEWIILLYGLVWSADSLAYYVGKGIGKRKLYTAVSPHKTVEGAFGSLVGGVVGALIVRVVLIPQLTIPSAVFIGLIIGLVSIVGDLVESMFKRDAGVKDSGVLIPGHGGILDKIDGALFAGPVLYWMMKIMGVIQNP